MTDSPTLKRLQETHPTLRFENCLEGALLVEAITALDESNETLRVQLANIDGAFLAMRRALDPALRDAKGIWGYDIHKAAEAALQRQQARDSEEKG